MKTITPGGSLPELDGPVTIDGFTQAGASDGGTGWGGVVLAVAIDGTAAGPGADGLRVNGGSSTVRGLAIHSFPAYGIRIQQPGDANNVSGNFIGTDAAGLSAHPNQFGGIRVESTHNVVRDNILSGNAGPAVDVRGADNTMLANNVGLAFNGTPLGNGGRGIEVHDAAHATIDGNVVSSNGLAGILVAGTGATGAVITGNLVGTDLAGGAPRANGTDGISLVATPGPATIAGNTVSGNVGDGISLVAVSAAPGTVDIRGNKIGTNTSGTAAVANGHGVSIFQSTNILVGDPSSGLINVISGNQQQGVAIDLSSSGNRVDGNYIGTDVTGLAAISNGGAGVAINGSANVVGNAVPRFPATNLISGNAGPVSASRALRPPAT